MKNFNEWLKSRQEQQLNEAAARLRTRYQAPSELSNVGIGRIGPLGTFGQETSPGDVERAIGGVMGALGQAIQKDLVKPTAVSRLEVPLIYKRLTEGVPLEIYMKLPLQVPVVGNDPNRDDYIMPVSTASSGYGTNKKNMRDKIDVLSDKRIRKEGETKESDTKFAHVTREMERDNAATYDKAVAFTTALIIEVIKMQHTNLETYFDFEKPKIVSRSVQGDELDVGIQLKPKKPLPLGKTARDISPDDPKEKNELEGDEE